MARKSKPTYREDRQEVERRKAERKRKKLERKRLKKEASNEDGLSM